MYKIFERRLPMSFSFVKKAPRKERGASIAGGVHCKSPFAYFLPSVIPLAAPRLVCSRPLPGLWMLDPLSADAAKSQLRRALVHVHRLHAENAVLRVNIVSGHCKAKGSQQTPSIVSCRLPGGRTFRAGDAVVALGYPLSDSRFCCLSVHRARCHSTSHSYRHGVKRPGDVILGVIAATATALLLALIPRDAIGMPADMVRDDAFCAAGFIFAAVSLG
jgi:hypothetical protein